MGHYSFYIPGDINVFHGIHISKNLCIKALQANGNTVYYPGFGSCYDTAERYDSDKNRIGVHNELLVHFYICFWNNNSCNRHNYKKSQKKKEDNTELKPNHL